MIRAVLDCLSEVEDGPMLLKTPHTENTGHGLVELDLTRKASSPHPRQFDSHGFRKYYSSSQEGETVKQSHPTVTPMNYDGYQHGKIGIQVQEIPCLWLPTAV